MEKNCYLPILDKHKGVFSIISYFVKKFKFFTKIFRFSKKHLTKWLVYANLYDG